MIMKFLDGISTDLLGTTFAPHQWAGAALFVIGFLIFCWPE